MTVILVDKMPQNCGECPLRYEDSYFSMNPPTQCNFVYAPVNGLDVTRKHEDCPLKSIDGLIEKITEYRNKNAGDDEFNVGQLWGIDEVTEIIKEYCGMEDAE